MMIQLGRCSCHDGNTQPRPPEGSGWNKSERKMQVLSKFCTHQEKNPDLLEVSNSQREERIQNNQNNNSLDIKTEQNDEKTCDEDENMEDRSSEHTDFLDKAVAVAIQKKGLSTLVGVDYG